MNSIIAMPSKLQQFIAFLFSLSPCIIDSFSHPNGGRLLIGKIHSDDTRSRDLNVRSTSPNAVVSESSEKFSDRKNGEIWWMEGLKFGCTACGKCCQNEGEVWMDSDEFADLTTYLQKSPLSVLDQYSERIMNGWVKMKSQGSDDSALDATKSNRCIFLGENGKECSIYEARPIQCRTYPFWPRLLDSPKSWEDESVSVAVLEIETDYDDISKIYHENNNSFDSSNYVKIDDISSDNKKYDRIDGLIGNVSAVSASHSERYWTSTTGGCEGIGHPDAPIIKTGTIHRNQELYSMYTKSFPFSGKHGDKEKLLARTRIVNVSPE